MMKSFFTAVMSITMLVFVPTSSSAEDLDRISARQGIMKYVGSQMRTLGAMAQGREDINPEYVASIGNSINLFGSMLPILFDDLPDGYPIQQSGASLEIATNRDEFAAESAEFANAGLALASNPGNPGESFDRLSSTCKSCHSRFRQPHTH